MKLVASVLLAVLLIENAAAFSFVPVPKYAATTNNKNAFALSMGLFDGFLGQGSGKDRLDEQWEAQQEILRNRRKPQLERDEYFRKVRDQRVEASQKQIDMWGWQTKKYAKGEDPIDEWRKQRAKGNISDLDNQYGDPKKIGGIPLPMASFGVGGEFGVGGKFDNGGRFDLRLPYAEQGYVDEDADVMGKLASFFGGNKKKENSKPAPTPVEEPEKKKKGGWPWQ
ncbi:hypothetical protein ACA910_022426 [Epithemia clementina (nom. ined.)]